MRHYLLPILIIVMLNSIPVQVFKRKFGEALPVTLFGVPLVMYASQFIFRTFDVAVFGLAGAAVLGFVVLLVRRRNLRDFLTSGLIAFGVVWLVVTVLDWGRTFSDFDEFWHWGPMVKEMLRLDQFYCVDASRLIIHKDYPSFLALFELFWSRIGGSYQEGVVSVGLHCLCIGVVLAPLSEKMSFSGKWVPKAFMWSFSICAAMLAIAQLFDHAHTDFTLLADFPLGLFFAFGLYQILDGEPYESPYGAAVLVLTGIMVVMTKQVGLALLGILVLMYAVVGALERRGAKRVFIGLGALIALPLALYASWSAYVSSLGVTDIRSMGEGTGQFTLSKVDPGAYIDALLKQAPGLQQDTLWNFAHALFDRSITSFEWLPLSYVATFVLMVVALVLLAVAFRQLFPARKALGVGIVLFAGTAAYAFMLSVLFLFCFTPDEMQELRGYERYVGALVLGEAVALFMLAVTFLERSRRPFWGPRACAALVLVSVVFCWSNLSYFTPQSLQEEVAREYRVMADNIENVAEPDSSVLMVYDASKYSGWYGEVQSYVYYYANYYDIPWGSDLYNTDYSGSETRASITDQLREIDYLYVLQTNEKLDGFFRDANNGNGLSTDTIYKVSFRGDGLSLEEASR